MKYQVQIKYTNPMHEHVSLRRRVESITRIVEAADEGEALNRAANQQRALGFRIQEAVVVKPESEEKSKKKKKVVGTDNENTDIAPVDSVKEGFDPEPSDIAAHLVKKHGKGKVTKDHVDAYERDRDSNRAIDKEAVMKHVQKMSEEVDQMDEANMRFDPEAAARPKSSDVKNFLNRDKNPRAAAASKKYIRRMTKLGGLGPNQTKKDTEAHMKAHFEEVEQVEEGYKDGRGGYKKFSGDGKPAKQPLLGKEGSRRKGHIRDIVQSLQLMDASKPISADHHAKILSKLDRLKEEVELDEASKEGKDVMRNMRAGLKSMDLRHGVDSDKRDAGYKMSPAVKAAQAKSDALSKVVKRPQAGTLAAVHKSMEREMLKKEEVETEKKSGSKKAAKAAEKMISAAKGKVNKINLEPKMDIDIKSK